MTSISKSKRKSYSDIKILQTIIEKLAKVELRQESIYKKFAKLHKQISKEANIQTLESELKAVQELVDWLYAGRAGGEQHREQRPG